MQIDESKVKGRECVFATYSANKYLNTDALIVKERVHLEDGTKIPRVVVYKDLKWPFYVTRKGFRNHKDHKEYEDMSRLQRYEARRIDLAPAICRALGLYKQNPTLRDISDCPYFYGTDILPTSLIKQRYRNRWPDSTSLSFDVAGLDIETDVVWGTEEIIMVNITMRDKSYTAVTKKFAKNTPNFIQRCHDRAKELIPNDIKDLKWEIQIVQTPGEACAKVLEKAHEWKPDFISIWNMSFDIPRMQLALQREGYNTADVFSDPSVPPEYRFFNYKEGKPIKVTQSGKSMPIHIADRWHVVTCPASFYFLDSMCLRKRIRVASGNESSYALNSILKTEGLEAKLKIQEAEEFETDGNVWHREMQSRFQVEYTIYNLIDDKRLIDYDDKTGDISRAFPTLAGISDFGHFNQNPRRIADDLHFFYLEREKVVGATFSGMRDDPLNKLTVGLDDWIVTLPSYMIQSGIPIFKDAPYLKTMCYQYLSDLDIEGTYPNEEDCLNISKETTKFEAVRLQGASDQQMRQFSLNLTGGHSNALELAMRFLNYPSPSEILAEYEKTTQD